MKMAICATNVVIRLLVLLFLSRLFKLVSASPDVADLHKENSCGKGHYQLFTSFGPVCVQCPAGFYMDEDSHHHSACKVCTSSEQHIQSKLVLEICTPASDTVFKCIDNNSYDRDTECRICSECHAYTARASIGEPCTPQDNTACCQQPGMHVDWINTGNSFKCVSNSSSPPTSDTCEGSILRTDGCLAGEYVSLACQQSDRLFYCRPCGQNSYMNLSKHNKTFCTPCSLPTESDCHIVSKCDKAHDNVYATKCLSTSIFSMLITSGVTIVILFIIVAFLCYRSWHGSNHSGTLKDALYKLIPGKKRQPKPYERTSALELLLDDDSGSQDSNNV